MAPHSSTLAWKIPWMEEPGRLQRMGSLWVGHDWVTSLSLFTFMHWRRKWHPTPVSLPGESQGWGSLVGCRLWGRTESDTTEATAAAAAARFNGIPQILIHCVFIFIHFKILLNYHFIYFWLMGYSKVCHLVSKYLVIIRRPLWFWHLIFNFYQRTYFFITWVIREFVDFCFTVQKMVHFDKISKFI